MYNNKSIGLYIHIPFCKAKCHYCDFNSRPGAESLITPYFKALEDEIASLSSELNSEENTISTIFIGGGTPSLAEPEYISRLLTVCRNNFNIHTGAEITIESNPGTLTDKKLDTYLAAGINRLSMGLQACQERLLKLMGRIHTVREFEESFRLAVNAGFKNINLDLIFGLPGQTMEDWKETLDCAIKPGVTHLSCYSLKIEEGTEFARGVKSGRLIPVEDELDREMYGYAIKKLAEKGYLHYEISNFALPGYECRHNCIYWKAEEYAGIGAGAHSYLNGVRYNNVCGIEDYISYSGNSGLLRENIINIDKKDSMDEYIILGLRMTGGIDPEEFKKRYGEDLFDIYGNKFSELMEKGLVEERGERLALSRFGLDVANIVFAEFI